MADLIFINKHDSISNSFSIFSYNSNTAGCDVNFALAIITIQSMMIACESVSSKVNFQRSN